MLDNIRIVLVGTTHPGNIGAVARAMKTMGLQQLYLVAPQRFPDEEACARASGADDVLERAVVCDSLDEALQGCVWVAGSSARPRSIGWPLQTPRACAAQLVAEARHAAVALVFGREHSGLSNDELDRCHVHVRIPTDAAFSSLNLAAAVQVLAYELRVALPDAGAADPSRPQRAEDYAGADEMALFYRHLEQVLIELDFLDPGNPRQLMRRLRRLFGRIRPDRNEVNILRGILTAVQERDIVRQRRTASPK